MGVSQVSEGRDFPLCIENILPRITGLDDIHGDRWQAVRDSNATVKKRVSNAVGLRCPQQDADERAWEQQSRGGDLGIWRRLAHCLEQTETRQEARQKTGSVGKFLSVARVSLVARIIMRAGKDAYLESDTSQPILRSWAYQH